MKKKTELFEARFFYTSTLFHNSIFLARIDFSD